MKDISKIEDIKILVDEFYTKIRKDPLLGPIFNKFITDWDLHLPKMYSFWQTLLLKEHTYTGAPFPPHVKLPIKTIHFDQWLKLFNITVDEYFKGQVANDAKAKANQIAQIFNSKMKQLDKLE